MRALLTSPEYDPLTHYLRAWAKKLKRNKNAIIKHLERDSVNRKKFESLLRKRSFDVIILNGHGASDRLAGENGEIILDKSNVELLKDKSVHALSCKTAQKLGKDAIAAGAKAYIGYDEDFMLVYDESKITKPEQDETAKLFLDAAFTAPKALLNGKSADEAVKLAKSEYDRSIIKAFNSEVQSDNDQFIKHLIWNKNHLKSC